MLSCTKSDENIDGVCKLDLPNQPCENSPSYSFTACIKNSISRVVGCRMEWDTWSDPAWPVCQRVDQIKMVEAEYFKLEESVQAEIVNNSDCPLPCRYKEYQIIGEPEGWESSKLLLGFVFADWEITETIEEEIYSFVSFVSEFGGSLGLFTGFSFYMLLDPLIFSLKFLGKKLLVSLPVFNINCIVKLQPNPAQPNSNPT